MSDDLSGLRSQLRDAENRVRVVEGTLKTEKRRRLNSVIWSAIGGALLVIVGGQWFPGYQLDSTATASARVAADGAVGDVMAELCAERFMATTGLESRLVALNEAKSDWNQATYIRDGQWAARPGAENSDHATAEKCRRLVAERVSVRS